ncbi:MAG TPA: type 4a pilus biogenesis protein PilO [Acidimicrobiales bacterium]|nr:type 4a pilus biogenesis protein PilO [Acidimicrobiales bacterium]
MEFVRRFRNPIIIGAGALVVVIVVFVAVISPEGSTLTSLQARQSQLQSQQVRLQGEIATLRNEKAHLAANCQVLTTDIAEIPGAPDVDSFLNQVTALAVASGDPNTPSISVTQAPTGATGGGVTAVAVEFTLSGAYGQMTSFLQGLTAFPRLFTVSTISIAGGPAAAGGGPVAPSTPNYTLTLSGDIYYSVGREDVCSNGALAGSATTTSAQ